MKNLIIVYCLFLTISVIAQQDNSKENSKNLNSVAISFDAYSLDLGLIFETGGGITYTRDFWSKGKHNLAYQPSVSFLDLPNTEKRYIFGAGVLYRFDVTKHGSIGLSLAGNYIYTHLAYDRFEYNAKGEFINEGSSLNSFAPSIGLQYSYDFLRIKSTSIGVLLASKLIRFNSGNYVKTFEGHNYNMSIGFYCKF